MSNNDPMARVGLAGIQNDGVRFLFVPGHPAPAGSKTGFPIKRKNGTLGVAMADASKRSKPWKIEIALHARDGWRTFTPFDGPVAVRFEFVMPRPKWHYGSKLGTPYLKPSAPTYHTSKPDALKLARAAEDALIGIAYADDAQIASEHITKVYGDKPGVTIRMWSLARAGQMAVTT